MISIADISKFLSAIQASIDAFDVFAESYSVSDFEFTEVANIWAELAETANDGTKALLSIPHCLRNNAIGGIMHHFSIQIMQIILIIKTIQYHSYLGGHITNIVNGRPIAALTY